MAYPIVTPQELSLPLLNLLCGRGAKRQVPAGSHFLLPRCWTKTHLLLGVPWRPGEQKQVEQACEQELTESSG